MSVFRTFYDVLGVAPTASEDVIRAAYRVLSQKYHPDRNPHNPQAHQMMTQINEAYAVLSDPEQRHQHDVWIARQQLQSNVAPTRLNRQHEVTQGGQAVATVPALGEDTNTLATQGHGWLWLLAAALVVVMGGVWWKMTWHKPAALSASIPGVVMTAPNGQSFPVKPAYVSGYPVLRERGRNVIHVDASGLNTAVFAQLYELRAGKFTAIRSFYVPAGDVFDVKKLGDGDFSLQYQRLDNGAWQVSDAIQIQHTESSGQFREIDIRL
ncbi:J domain-containing protein [Snodgrassella sp. CFCC 13594]|uniref:J domain-containing protein n=1 Tax=Snodgrassella sp. CFCC 13594 TaxID=1775559 RepID=UPI000829C77A|nr:J domain-containing protein [Snodgrassella sp. CFCC 13594]